MTSLKLPSQKTVKGPLTEKNINELRDFGYTVVSDFLDSDTCDSIQNRWLSVIENYNCGFDREKSSEWKSVNLPIGIRGMQDYPPIAQQSFVWDTRILLAPIFAALWNCEEEELVSSMDRVCFVPKTMLRRKNKSWWHLDQAKTEKWGKLECIQGFVTLEDIDPGDVALQVLSGAHDYHAEFMKKLGEKHKDDWYKFKGEDLEWYTSKPKVELKSVFAKKGSVVLWDSRIPHQAQRDLEAMAKRIKKDNLNNRYVIYVCMLPRERVKESKLAARIKAFEEGRATSHWPTEAKLFAKMPRWGAAEAITKYKFNQKKQLRHRDEKVTNPDLMRKLAGY